MITKQDLNSLKQNDRIESFIKVVLIQGNYINKSIVTGALIIITVIMAFVSPLFAILFLIFCFFKVIRDKKGLNKDMNELENEYFEIKPRGKN